MVIAEPVEEAATPALDTSVVDQKVEETTKEPPTADVAPVTLGPVETPAAPVETSKPEAEKVADPDVTAEEVAEEVVKEAEKPTDPSPTPVKTRQPPPPAVAPTPTPAQPPKHMTWASRAAAAAGAGPRPVVPLPKTTTSPAAQPRPAAPASPATAQPPAQPTAPTAQNAEPATPATPAKETSTEWQTAGSDSKRQTRPQSVVGPQAEKDGTSVYVKYVTDKVKYEDLKAALAQYGEMPYFDINRQKVSYLVSPG